MPFITSEREVAYSHDAAALFHALATPRDSLLLEAADIESKKNLNCIAITKAALRVTCRGQEVTARALTPTGEALLAVLTQEFAERLLREGEGQATFGFEFSDEIDERARLRDSSTADILRALKLDTAYSSTMLPFLGGGFAFDYLGTFEHLPEVAEGVNDYPDYEFLVAEELLSVNHLDRSARVEGVGTDKQALEESLTRSADLAATAAADSPKAPSTETEAAEPKPLRATASVDDATFRRNVKQLKKNIDAGDIYQVVPARSFSLDCPDAFAAYRRLRDTNPSPYMFYIRGADYELFGASPESNLKFTAANRMVQLYPIAGTRPRGLNPDGTINPELDIRNELEMRTDHKEVAEHTMLVDLARNDLARVAVPRTRMVKDLLQVDRYSRVMHLVSRVTATLDPDFDALDAYRACMNMGTLTGAPKLRAMELLREVEGTRRGSYGGAVGYLRGDGSMDNCIVIRSAYVKGGTAVVQAGAGVVRDSIPQSEADETVHKAYAVLNAIALAQGASLEVVR
ncbi:anthranilate synthase component 1 [Corynebacterium flavescens]|uniref:anthranilate synthase component 1 n=1 Tax=Corynebacterium flavescens TaxID=28028 RepID=UPI00264970EA|nr:anthranilate synthase component 1 [Corynebacterium flavescens]MDN6100283.1 anthranilate synthase component 1 [Corynebacterium flavescens]MDN6199552.1 anthranilate synthase component 1 [Corynebacterium flavescens]MDN6225884.1 anthranilate synthase component 1 [Corynebacterium flavescens]MDN6235093.1 anthranilate synthase component 1 [Corynebacterium flavescens]